MHTEDKGRVVAELTEKLRNSETMIVADSRGLTMPQIDALRSKLIENGARFTVVKNTLTRRAAEAAGADALLALLEGPSAIAFVTGDAVTVAKSLRDFGRNHPLLVVKGGVLDGKALSAAEVAKIADLESREVLLAKLAGALKALPTRAAGLFQAPLSQMARLAKALEEKKPAEAAAAAPEAAAEAPEAAAVAVDAADEPAEAPAEATETPAEPAE